MTKSFQARPKARRRLDFFHMTVPYKSPLGGNHKHCDAHSANTPSIETPSQHDQKRKDREHAPSMYP